MLCPNCLGRRFVTLANHDAHLDVVPCGRCDGRGTITASAPAEKTREQRIVAALDALNATAREDFVALAIAALDQADCRVRVSSVSMHGYGFRTLEEAAEIVPADDAEVPAGTSEEEVPRG